MSELTEPGTTTTTTAGPKPGLPRRGPGLPVRALAVAATVAGLGLGLAPAASFAGDAAGWERVRTEDGIVVSRKEIPGSPFVAFRGEGYVEAPLLTTGSVLVDVPHEKD